MCVCVTVCVSFNTKTVERNKKNSQNGVMFEQWMVRVRVRIRKAGGGGAERHFQVVTILEPAQLV